MEIITKPQTKRREGRPEAQSVRWSFQMAEREFGVKRDTLVSRARQLNILSAEDGAYSSADIAKMIFGDKEAETIGKLAAERRQVELKNALTEGELISVSYVIRLAESFLVPVRQRILSSSLTEDERAEMLDDLVKFGEVDWKTEAIDAHRKA